MTSYLQIALAFLDPFGSYLHISPRFLASAKCLIIWVLIRDIMIWFIHILQACTIRPKRVNIIFHVRSCTIWSDTIIWHSMMILVLVLAIHNMIWHIKILHNLTSHDSIWHNVMILVSIQQHNMIWHIKILHNAQVSQSLEQKSYSFTDKSFRAHTRRTMRTTIGEGDETHIGVHTYKNSQTITQRV